jgi:hypothetical protein
VSSFAGRVWRVSLCAEGEQHDWRVVEIVANLDGAFIAERCRVCGAETAGKPPGVRASDRGGVYRTSPANPDSSA